jgi:dethiobiotin synthetase
MTSRFFVTGTDTGVGKTQVSAALLATLAARGHRPFAFKPCESGGTEDGETLWAAAGAWQAKDSVCLYRLEAPLAPAIAARLEKKRVDWKRLLSGFRALGDGPGVVEGAGGLFVPMGEGFDVVDFAQALKLPVVLVARATLGTINHTTLSLHELLRRKLRVAGVVLSHATPGADLASKTNRAELQRRFPRVPFFGPVRFEADPVRRRALFRRAVAPLLASRP